VISLFINNGEHSRDYLGGRDQSADLESPPFAAPAVKILEYKEMAEFFVPGDSGSSAA
jgi:hypothetical protein